MSKTEDIDWEVWSDSDQGFPYYMEQERIDEQKWLLSTYIPTIRNRMHFTGDWPRLAKHDYQYVMVYGTLKTGYQNHSQLKPKQAQYICDVYTYDECYTMFQTKGNIPVVLPAALTTGKGKRIKGELYLVKSGYVPDLDAFEQNGVLYRRLKFRTRPLKAPGICIPAWMYMGIQKVWGSYDGLEECPSVTSKKDPSLTYYHYLGGSSRGSV